MLKKNVLKLSAIMLGVLVMFGFTGVQASNFGEVNLTRENLKTVAENNTVLASMDNRVLSISKNRESGNYYNWNKTTTSNGKTVWKIATIKSGSRDYTDLYYCLNAAQGFGLSSGEMAEGARDTYTTKYDMKDSADKSSIISAANGNLGANYNKVLWILDHSYIPTGNSSYKTSTDYRSLMSDAGISIDNAEWDLTEDDIEVVQQMAIWYFTNSSTTGYNNSELPSLYINGEQLSSIYYGTDEYGEQMTGAERQSKANKLYKYFINNASSSYTATVPTLTVSNSSASVTESGNYYIAGPFSLSGTNTSLIDSITASVSPNKSYTLLDSSKNAVSGNNFKNVMGENFYLRFNKSDITTSTTITLNLNYTYHIRSLTMMTNDNETAQAVVLVKEEDQTKPISTNVTINLTSISVEKVWSDNDNEDGVRPSSVRVALYEGTTKKEEQTLSASNSWKYTWSGLLAGKTYSVKELNASGTAVENNGNYNSDYTATYSTSGTKTTVTNSHTPAPKNPDLALRKYITSVAGTEIASSNSNYRVPQTDTAKLDNETDTTARYVHKKDPIEVKTGDKVIYNITVYNEGDVAARASKITDQLPTGLKYERIITSGYTADYTESTNRLVITKTGTNNLAAYTKNGTLASETIQVECSVTATAGTEQKVLTNIAWISEMKDSSNNTFTSDRDSQTTNSPNYNKDNMSGYNGNGNDNGYIKGQQDDDDFDRIVINPLVPEENDYSVKLLKVGENGTTALSGAWFKINNGQATLIAEDGTQIATGKLNEAGNLDLTFNLEETTAPDGYEQISGTTEVKIRAVVELTNNTYDIASVSLREAVDGVTVSESDNVITIKVKNTPEVITGKYDVVLTKVDEDGNQLNGAKMKVNGTEYTVGSKTVADDVAITSTEDITLNYAIEEITAPEGYIGLSETKNIKLKLEVEKLGKNYTVRKATLIDASGNETTVEDVNVSLNSNTITIKVVNHEIIPELDFSLRKFITSVNDTAINREPKVDTSTIATTGTATYKHTKDPVSVQIGDVVTYKIRVYNEGEVDGYISEITDHLPEWLDFLPNDELNQKYLWEQDQNNSRTIRTKVAAKDSATGEEIYSSRTNKQLLSAYQDGNTDLDYIDVEIRCKVNSKAKAKQLITNIADISGMQDKDGTDITTDRDSTKDNVTLPSDTDLPNYKGHEDNKEDLSDSNYYYKGQEDDDDFEKLIVETFDLNLKKFAVMLNEDDIVDKEGNFIKEPKVDASKLGTTDEDGNTVTDATYTMNKNPIRVKKGDIVTYKLRIYNEGTLDGFANEIVDYIPAGLKFIEESSINKQYGWKVDGNNITTTYLSDSNINNVIKAVSEDEQGSKILDYKDVQVQFEVIADPIEYTEKLITNWAEIKDDSNNDIDSTPGNNVKEEDDIDYDPIELTYFDLSLRKFITKVNTTDYNNRVPEVDTSKLGTVDEKTGKRITTASYKHTKDPVIVETGNTVEYTIRIYNEGTMAGYANEITDNIPAGLQFLPSNSTNTTYKWKMLDKDGKVTTDATKAVKITTNYLSEDNGTGNQLAAYQGKELAYKDVKVAFKVIEPNTSDRVVVNTAEISKASEEDVDSTPGNNKDGEDDIDKEYLKVQTFDLALKKWVTATKVTYNGKTKTTKTGFDENSTGMAKVDLVGKKLKNTTVKFVYNIKVTNEGQVAGYAYEVKDYIPSGLKFEKADNPKWTLHKDGTATTDQLKDTLLQPGQSATVEIVLTWKKSTTNMGVKTNWAEISKDSGDDIDSTPDNNNKSEDDIDNAKVVLSIKTGRATTYIVLAFASVSILAAGTYMIKKRVLEQ